MRLLFLVNELGSLKPSQSTFLLLQEARRQGHEVFVCGVRDVSSRSAGVSVRVWRAGEHPPPSSDCPGEVLRVDAFDRVLIRTNPGRYHDAPLHTAMLHQLARAERAGVKIFNSPAGLLSAGSKLFLTELPEETIPTTIASGDRAELRSFVNAQGRTTVLKPALGTRGNGVFFLEPQDRNLDVVLDALLAQGLVIGQGFVPDARAGDTRVVLLDGEVLELGGRALAVRRVPAKGSLRSNVHVGGVPTPGVVTSEMRACVRAIAPILQARGLRLVGLDFFGDLIGEVNVFSTGGFGDAQDFFERNFVEHTVARLCAGTSTPSSN